MDDDSPTMTSVVMRVVGTHEAEQVDDYTPNAALKPVPGIGEDGEVRAAPAATRPPVAAGTGARARDVPVPPAPGLPAATGQTAPEGATPEPAPPVPVAAAVQDPGMAPVAETKAPQTERPVAPQPAEGLVVEVADAPQTGSAVLDLLEDAGWRVHPAGEPASR
jgi:hypothetical protein